MELEQTEPALGEEDSRLHVRRGLEREVDETVDRERRSDLDDETVVSLDGRIAPRPDRRRHVRRELGLKVLDGEIDPKLGHANPPLRRAAAVNRPVQWRTEPGSGAQPAGEPLTCRPP